MISKEHLTTIVEAYLEGSDQFLVEVRVTPSNKLMVFLDGDSGVSIGDCSRLSRHIEAALDREAEDFELEVSSVGVGYPLQLIRQYRNNIGRRLMVVNHEGEKVKGRLAEVSEDGIMLEKDKPPKGPKQKKEPDTDKDARLFIPLKDVVEAKVQVSFNRK